jgi:cytochrome c oxidase subunit I
VLVTVYNVFASIRKGRLAPPDPWQANTLEWFTPSPPPPHNFDVTPRVRSLEPMKDYRRAVQEREAAMVNGHGAGQPAESPGKQPEPL